MAEDEQIVGEKPNSVKFAINAKGQWSGEVKAYAETIDEAMELGLKKAKYMDTVIKNANKASEGDKK